MDWELMLIMPDLQLSSAVDVEYMAIAPYEDERVQSIIADSAEAKKLLTGFSDYKGDSVEPPALILRKDAPDSTKSLEAAVALRNTLALSTVLYSTDGNFAPVYSDSFDFYPVRPASSKGFFISNPALLSHIGPDTPFTGITNPAIPSSTPLLPNSGLDVFIYHPLLHFWQQRFVSPGKDSLFSRTLFRSLQVAYHASSSPVKNQSSIHDFGISAAHWINALEILAHPHSDEGVNKWKVIRLVGSYRWQNWKLNANWYKIGDSKGTIIQRVCHRLYSARNDFIHGNKVNAVDLRSLPYRPQAPSLPRLAPVIYRTALFQYLMNEIDEAALRTLVAGETPPFPADSTPNYYQLKRLIVEDNYETRLLRVIDPDHDD